MINLSLLTIISLVISGCVYRTPPKMEYVYVSVPLSHDPRPQFPKVSGSELSCLSTETKNTLITRDTLMKNYMEQLEVIIDSTKRN